jgi:hypothetical protein
MSNHLVTLNIYEKKYPTSESGLELVEVIDLCENVNELDLINPLTILYVALDEFAHHYVSCYSQGDPGEGQDLESIAKMREGLKNTLNQRFELDL